MAKAVWAASTKEGVKAVWAASTKEEVKVAWAASTKEVAKVVWAASTKGVAKVVWVASTKTRGSTSSQLVAVTPSYDNCGGNKVSNGRDVKPSRPCYLEILSI